jgi:organic radical activating enzyme
VHLRLPVLAMSYRVNEVFLSIQGEGVRVGTANVFVRFSGCNLKCRRDVEGFDCDTEFSSGVTYEAAQLIDLIHDTAGKTRAVILTGGEPTLQVDETLVAVLRLEGFFVAIETNGTNPVSEAIDWVSCSPKTAEHTLRVGRRVNELRYVRHAGHGLPKPSLAADQLCISPAVQPDGSIRGDDLENCIRLVKENPPWRLSIQLHKFLAVR